MGSNRVKDLKGNNGVHPSMTRKDHSYIVNDFIKGYIHIIEPSVLKVALKNDENAMSLALGQIHHKTLPD